MLLWQLSPPSSNETNMTTTYALPQDQHLLLRRSKIRQRSWRPSNAYMELVRVRVSMWCRIMGICVELCSVVMGCAPGSVIPPLQNTHSNRRTTNGAMADDLVWIIILNFGDHLLTRDHCRLIHIKQYLGRQGGRG